jgi:hypothetical protein
MRSIESDKVCKRLTCPNRMFLCPKSYLHSGQIITAPCMMDPTAGAYIKAELCERYQKK